MILRSATALIVVGLFAFGRPNDDTYASTPSSSASPSLPKPPELAPFKERLTAATALRDTLKGQLEKLTPAAIELPGHKVADCGESV